MLQQQNIEQEIEKLASKCLNGDVQHAVDQIKQLKTADAAMVALQVHAALLRSGAYVEASQLSSVKSWAYH